LCEGLRDATRLGYNTDGGFKQAAWDLALEKVSCRTRERPTKAQASHKLDNLKRTWKAWKQHLGATDGPSGWGVNSEGVPEASTEVMNDYFARHKDRAPFRHKPPPYKELLDEILGDKLATGSATATVDDILNGAAAETLASSTQEPDTPLTSIETPSDSSITTRSTSVLSTTSSGSVASPLTRKRTAFSSGLVAAIKRRKVDEDADILVIIQQAPSPLERALELFNQEFTDLPQEDRFLVMEAFGKAATGAAVIFLNGLGYEERKAWVERIIRRQGVV